MCESIIGINVQKRNRLSPLLEPLGHCLMVLTQHGEQISEPHGNTPHGRRGNRRRAPQRRGPAPNSDAPIILNIRSGVKTHSPPLLTSPPFADTMTHVPGMSHTSAHRNITV
jgi:hypothetical protein